MPYHGTKRLMTSWFPKLIMVFVFRPIISSLSHYMLMTCFWRVTIYFLLIHIKLYYPMPWNDKTQRSIMVIRYHNKEGLKQESVDHVTIIFHKKDLEQFSMSNCNPMLSLIQVSIKLICAMCPSSKVEKVDVLQVLYK